MTLATPCWRPFHYDSLASLLFTQRNYCYAPSTGTHAQVPVYQIKFDPFCLYWSCFPLTCQSTSNRGSNSKNNTFTWWDTLYNMNEWDWIIPGMITSHQTLYGTGEKWINLINPIVKPTFTLYSLWHHCSLVYILSNQYFFALSLLMRVIAGIGSSMLTVAVTSTLMKATSFKSTTIIVSQSQITVKVKSVCWYQQISCSRPKIGRVSWGTRPIQNEAIMALLFNSCLLLLRQSSFSGLSIACLNAMLEI